MCLITFFKNEGKSLAIQWLGVGASTSGAWVRSLVRDLSSYKLRSVAKRKEREKRKKQQTNNVTFFCQVLSERIAGYTPFTQGAVWFRKTKNKSRARAQSQPKVLTVLPSLREHRLSSQLGCLPRPFPTPQSRGLGDGRRLPIPIFSQDTWKAESRNHSPGLQTKGSLRDNLLLPQITDNVQRSSLSWVSRAHWGLPQSKAARTREKMPSSGSVLSPAS